MQKRPQILVIDDEPTIIRVFREIFPEKDNDVHTASGGREGLEKFRSARPHVIFTDIRMPDMDGLEFLRQVRELDPDVPVILITAYGDKQTAGRAVRLGAFDFIDKPFRIEDVRAVFKRAFGMQLLLHQRRRNETRTGRIENFARRLNAARSLDDLFETIREELGPALGVRYFSLFLHEAKSDRLRLACSNHVRLPAGQELPLEGMRGPMKDVVASRQAVVIDDFERSDYKEILDDGWQKPFIHKSSATIPLMVRDSLVAVLNINDKTEPPGEFDATDVAFLTIAAEHLASAVAVRQEAAELARTIGRLEETQQSLIQSEKLAALTKLVAGVAHELKNPLTSLQFAATNMGDELNKLQAAGAETAKARRFLDGLSADIDRLHNRVHRFVMFARPERIRKESCSPEEIVSAALEQVAQRAQAAGVRIEVDCEPDLPGVVADVEAFTQAVLNLLVNAVEAVDGGGRIDVTARLAEGRIQIVVKDTGPGIPDETAGHIFDFFFTTKPKGSGIGLSQVHVFCDTHGGGVSFETGPWGTTFKIELPAGDPQRRS